MASLRTRRPEDVGKPDHARKRDAGKPDHPGKPEHAGKHLEPLTLSLQLPAPLPEIPEDELRVAIDDVPISPAGFDPLPADTHSIEILTEEVIAAVEAEQAARAAREAAAADAAAPPLPEPRPPVSRYGRRYSAPRASDAATPPTEDRAGKPDRVRKPGRPRTKPTPEGVWPRFVYGVTLGLLNLGDSAAVRARKELEARIAGPTHDGAAFIPVISRKGGVGATTVTTILGMALADVRDDGVLAVDAHPDRGTLADRVEVEAPASVRDFVRRAHRIESPEQLANLVAHDPTGLDVLASDTDPDQSHPFSARSYG
ncbi:MAG: MinD/ParA family protein, partial [Schumannella sp.]|nr:MinD/ParA family protein [Schumannella sp.]